MKAPTLWRTNPSAETNEYPYDSATYTYDSGSQNYDGVVDSNMSDRGRLPVEWDRPDKQPASWRTNTSELISYDSANDAYDSSDQNYDGFVDTNYKVPTRWSNS